MCELWRYGSDCMSRVVNYLVASRKVNGMKRAKVGIFEDDVDWRELLTEIVEDSGHSVAVAVRDMDEARAAIDDLEEGSLDVAIVDGNLNPNESTGADGAEITRLLHKKLGAITVIGFSGINQIAGVDHSLSKAGDPDKEIPAIITGLNQ